MRTRTRNPEEQPAPLLPGPAPEPTPEEPEAEEEPACEECGDTGVTLYDADGRMLCDDCSFECEGCGERCPKDKSVDTSVGPRCPQCIENDFSTCENCTEYVPSDDTVTIQPREEIYCTECARSNAAQCGRCDEWFDPGRVSMTHLEDRDANYCEGCAVRAGAFHCESCDQDFSESAYGGTIGDRSLCESCYEREHQEEEEEEPDPSPGGALVGYHDYRRRWNRFGKASRNVYYGVELEAISDKDHSDYADVAEEITSKYGQLLDEGSKKEFLFTELDGSLTTASGVQRGYETIFHPMAPEFIAANQALFEKILGDMSASHMISYEAPPQQKISAGMHVTLSWDALDADEREKFLRLIYGNKKLTTIVSRRTKEDLDRWARVDPPATIEDMVRKKAGYDAKYVAVNLKHYHDRKTDAHIELAEVRVFRGTLKPESFTMNLEYVIACVEFARDKRYGPTETTEANLLAYIADNEKTYPHIAAWLKEKKLIEARNVAANPV